MSWFDNLLSCFAKDIAIDLGTTNTVIYSKGEGIVLDEPSVVAFVSEVGFDVPYLFGSQAKLMIGKTPMKISVNRPLKDGVIADFKVAEDMMRHFVKSISPKTRFVMPLIIVCVPLESTPVERRAIQEAAEK